MFSDSETEKFKSHKAPIFQFESKGGKDPCSQAGGGALGSRSIGLVVLFRPQLIAQGPPYWGWKCALVSLLLQVLISPKDALRDTPTVTFDQVSWHPMAQSG